MKRREFIAGLGAAAAPPALWSMAARAQQSNQIRRVGVLMNFAATQADGQSYVEAFIQRLRQLGWIEGRNLRIDLRWNAGDAGLARTFAAQLIGLMPDLLVASSTTNLTELRQITSTVPIVFISITDPVAQGFVASMSHPGGNLTGFSNLVFSIGGKWLNLLKQAAPGLMRVAVMFNPDTSPQSKFYMQAIEAAAPSLGVQAIATPVRSAGGIEGTLESFARLPNGGLMLVPDSFTGQHYPLIADLARRFRLPSIGQTRNFVNNGGLMFYGNENDLIGQWRQAAGYVDRILKGAKPSDLPVQEADRYTFIINLKTAKALNLEIPPGVLAIADEVIE